jgi:putative endonuclease
MAGAGGEGGVRGIWLSLGALLGLERFDRRGRWGEKVASRFLEAEGYEILAANYRVRGGEADLICGKDGLVVAVEVKSRQSFRFGTAAQAVTRRKARRVMSAGRAFCRKRGISLSRLRGDVITVEKAPSSVEPLIRHVPGGLADA